MIFAASARMAQELSPQLKSVLVRQLLVLE